MLLAQLDDALDDRSPWATRIGCRSPTATPESAISSAPSATSDLIDQVFACTEPYNECWLHYSLGRISYEWNDLAAAQMHYRTAARAWRELYARL